MKIARKISLDYLGDNHKDDYITFSGLSYKEAQILSKSETEQDADAFMELLKQKLMGGSIVDDETNAAVPITKENLEDLPVDVLTTAIERLVSTDSTLS